MLFNSYAFLLLYLPVTVWIFFRLGRYQPRLAAAWLGLASLFFYGYWNPVYVGLLLGSILFNYGVGRELARAHSEGAVKRRNGMLVLGVSANLALLAYYKYANFFIDTANHVLGTGASTQSILLPLGISFFTFTQIAFLVDTWAGKVKEYNFIHYLLFVTYFPHLIAGPVLHHKEMMPQFARPETYRLSWDNVTIGTTIFALGLFKKAVLADGVAPYANEAFSAAESGEPLDFFAAWGGALAYTAQLYFDFSGYSDMAIGLSRLFGIVLPLNFNSPYKARSMIEFWRSWHMTLSRFLRDYLYIPLGGSHKGRARRYGNLMATMLLGGLWHGASWNFVLWGGLHGLYLAINHAWRTLRQRMFPGVATPGAIEVWAGWLLTFVAVVVGWVFFRALTLDGAFNMLRGMAFMQGAQLPAAFAPLLGSLADTMQGWGVRFGLGGGAHFVLTWLWTLPLLTIAFYFPNTQEFMRHYRPGLDFDVASARAGWVWQPSLPWAVVIACLAAAGGLSLSGASEFLYYQF